MPDVCMRAINTWGEEKRPERKHVIYNTDLIVTIEDSKTLKRLSQLIAFTETDKRFG